MVRFIPGKIRLMTDMYFNVAEPWWVNSIIRNPVIIPFACGLRKLDMIYLDTAFAVRTDIHRKFPTKAEGITQLLQKISLYPKDTVFHFNAWTLGYEDVCLALSLALNSQVRVPTLFFQMWNSLN